MEYLTAKEVREKVVSNCALLLDVRSPEEILQTGSLPSAETISLTSLQECDVVSPSRDAMRAISPLESARDSGKDIIVFCTSGCRAATAWEILDGLGFPTCVAPSFASLREIFLQTGE